MQDYKKTKLWNSSLSLQERLDDLIRNLTLEEKFHFLPVGSPKIERLGIEPYGIYGEAAHGIEARHDQSFNKGEPEYTTTFTQPIGMSATWDTDLIEKVGIAVGNEARVLYDKDHKNGGLCRWAPTIDMERDPRWGRNEEAYGEDPVLTGKMASAYILGMRGRDPYYLRVGATLKHFYANNVERERGTTSSSIDPRNKREYYLEPFRKAIVDGKAEGIMTSYNEINGVPAISNPEVQHILKEEYGLAGHVVCDGGDMCQNVLGHKYCGTHAETIADSLKAGVDCFTDDSELVIAAAKEAFQQGLISEEDIDRSIRNSFTTKIRLGIFDAEPKNPYHHIPKERLDCEEHRALALECAKKAIVLLKNDSILPIQSKEEETIAIIGPLASVWYKDWYSGLPSYHITPEQGLREVYKSQVIGCETGLDQVRIQCAQGYLGLKEDGRIAIVDEEHAETMILNDWGFGSCTLQTTSTGKFLKADNEQHYVTALKEEVFGWFIMEAFDMKATNEEPIYAEVNQSSSKSFTMSSWNGSSFYINQEGYLCIKDNKSKEDKTLQFTMEYVKQGAQEARKLAKKADHVILVLGCNPVINSKEEIDRSDLILPPQQEALMKVVHEVNENSVLVLESNYPYAIGWAKEHMKAILHTASGSQELGRAIASAIAGEYSPAGRLNMTWYQSVSQLGDMNDYDIIKGKKTYQYFDGEVLYPFGYGLSYTQFSYDNLKVDYVDYTTVHVTADIKNVGTMDGDEVVQVYYSQLESRVKRPILKLCEFKRIFLKKGETKTVSFQIPISEFRYYDTVSASMFLEEGKYEIQVGVSSADIRLQETIYLYGQKALHRDITNQTYADHYDDYENIYLHVGSNHHCAALPVDSTKLARLIYRDAYVKKEVVGICMNLMAEEESIIQVVADGVVVGQNKIEPTKFFTEAQCQLEADNIPMEKSFTIEIIIQGKVRITSWYAIEK